MRILTRKQHLDFEAAQTVPLQAGKRVLNTNDLEALIKLVSFNPAHGAFVDSFDVRISTSLYPPTLRMSLALMPNITDLILIAPRLRNRTALRGVHLAQLQYFRTDLPHASLVDFLAAHQTITELDLLDTSHGADVACPLGTVNLNGLKCLSGPGACVPPLAPANLVQFLVELKSTAVSASLSLQKLTTPLHHLCTLVIDVCADDKGILANIAQACPTVRKLKLNEKPCIQTRRSITRQAWTDVHSWSRDLKKLVELEELLLRTTASLVRRRGDWCLERKLVTAWVHGVGRSDPETPSRAHPTLYHVGVWYNVGVRGGGCVAHWSKPSGTWERSASIVDPPLDFAFI
ncbi:hypothetical protein C8Q79DRAFT_1007359 [Trametes meyenii]|nr:hypothetical protein C8Q79DRAFT_1007359 [Trametes meyenii]